MRIAPLHCSAGGGISSIDARLKWTRGARGPGAAGLPRPRGCRSAKKVTPGAEFFRGPADPSSRLRWYVWHLEVDSRVGILAPSSAFQSIPEWGLVQLSGTPLWPEVTQLLPRADGVALLRVVEPLRGFPSSILESVGIAEGFKERGL